MTTQHAKSNARGGDGDDLILQAVARGWCAPLVSNRTMDVDLAQSIASEVRALFAALQAQQGAEPVGFVLVPREPTREMMRAGAYRWVEATDDVLTFEGEQQAARAAWAAMLACHERSGAPR